MSRHSDTDNEKLSRRNATSLPVTQSVENVKKAGLVNMPLSLKIALKHTAFSDRWEYKQQERGSSLLENVMNCVIIMSKIMIGGEKRSQGRWFGDMQMSHPASEQLPLKYEDTE